jgi:UDP-N-acetylmuramyl tripeptide synthase
VIARAEHVAKRLEALDCFEKVNIVIDSAKGPDSIPKALQVKTY